MLSIQKIGVIGRTYRHLNRYRQILAIFFKYGMGDLIDRLKIDQYIEVGLQMISKKRRDRVERLTTAERIRMAFEELGSTFIKFGQVLSTRPGLMPVDFIHEFSKLQDDVPPFSSDKAISIIESDLGSREDIFDFFNDHPVASASIGQVHRGRLKNGEEVAVKLRRPGIKKIIEVDLEIMLHIATLMEDHIEEFALHRPVNIVEEFARILEKEIDYKIEATNMERFASHFLGDPTIYVPKVFREATTERVLTMEYVEGIKISDVDRLDEAGLDRKEIISRGAELLLKQVFEKGFFHADPHPGNIFVLPNNVICFLDFGMVSTVSRETREIFVDLIDSVVHQNSLMATQALLKLTEWENEPNLRLLERELAEFMGQNLYKPLKDIEIGKIIKQVLEMVTRHNLMLPPDIFLMMKALGTVEGIASLLDPDFDMIAKATPFIRRVKLAKFHPKRISGDIIKLAADLRDFVQQFPNDILEITRIIRQHKLSINLELRGLESILSTHDQISNRISFSIIIAALLIGSALIVISKTPPLFFGISLIGMVGFFAAAFMGIWLLVAILRKGRL